MGSKESRALQPDKEPTKAKKTKNRRIASAPPMIQSDKENASRDQNERTEKMGSKEIRALQPDKEPTKAQKTKDRRVASAPPMIQSDNENASKDQNKRSNDVSKPGNEGQRNNDPVNAWTGLFGNENIQVLDLTNEDQKKQSKRRKKSKRHLKETRIADDIKTAEKNENHAASSSNDIKTAEKNENHAASSSNDMFRFYKNEENVKKQEVRVSLWSAEKDNLFTRVADDIKRAESSENHAASSSNNLNRDHKYEKNVQRLEARVSQLSAEKDELLNRLSEIGVIKLTDHNPKVTNLSDPHRPEKVVEEFSELYDNEWTDANEYLQKKQKENTGLSEKQLLHILQEVFKICMSSTESKTKALREALTNYVGLTDEDQDELDLKDIEYRIREYRRKKMQNNFKRTEEEVGNQLKRIIAKEIFDDLSEYIGSCVNICWKMCTKEPPMYLDFDDWEGHAQSSIKTATKMHFDKAKFMNYTTSGDFIDYVVWPAVYLYKDGPLMKKGVAQGIQEDEEYKDGPD